MTHSISITARLYRPAPCTNYLDPRRKKINQVRPQYMTTDLWVVPKVKIYEVTPTGGNIVALSKYEVVRDALAERYGTIEVIHDELLPFGKTECYPACRGAFRKQWWMCDCPCGGASHAAKNYLLNYRKVHSENLEPWLDGYYAKRTVYHYSNEEVTP